MRRLLVPTFALLTALAFGSDARADDKADCVAGIAMIKREIAKKPLQATLTALQKALRNAERELKEEEFDECVDAIEDAHKALRR